MADAPSNAKQSPAEERRTVLGYGSVAESPPAGLVLLAGLYVLVGGYLLLRGPVAGEPLGDPASIVVGIAALVVAFGLWNRRFWAGTVAAVFHMLYVPGALIQGGFLSFAGPVVSVIAVAYLWGLPDDVWT